MFADHAPDLLFTDRQLAVRAYFALLLERCHHKRPDAGLGVLASHGGRSFARRAKVGFGAKPVYSGNRRYILNAFALVSLFGKTTNRIGRINYRPC